MSAAKTRQRQNLVKEHTEQYVTKLNFAFNEVLVNVIALKAEVAGVLQHHLRILRVQANKSTFH
jgi:hypothetical protein